MKGKSSCYAAGGKIRNIGGIKAPAYGTSESVMKIAKKGGSEGRVGMAGIGADGVPAKARMDRPGRKFGGRMVKGKHKGDGDSDD